MPGPILRSAERVAGGPRGPIPSPTEAGIAVFEAIKMILQILGEPSPVPGIGLIDFSPAQTAWLAFVRANFWIIWICSDERFGLLVLAVVRSWSLGCPSGAFCHADSECHSRPTPPSAVLSTGETSTPEPSFPRCAILRSANQCDNAAMEMTMDKSRHEHQKYAGIISLGSIRRWLLCQGSPVRMPA